ncbi:MAG: phenylacetate--CoA ligase [Coriobacteriia bacterium]|nr:phenylacetate--CoA ligase [Coriobacteriia bacterium]
MYQEQLECMDRCSLDELQSQRLRAVVKNVYEKVDTYRNKFDELGIRPDDIRGIKDLGKLPFTVKDDLRKAYPYKMFAVPMKDIVRVHCSSGTTGQISVVGYTENDVEMWAECVARALSAAGLDDRDIVHIAYGYGLFTGGLGAHYGVEKLGAAAVPVSGGNTNRQVQILRDFGVTAIACTPSYALLVGETAKEQGVDPRELPLRVGIFGAEPWSESMRNKLENLFGIKALDIYGLSEIMGPGIGYECLEQNGLHINEDNFIIEILDTETLKPVPDGEYGEVVLTTLTKEGIPLIRYRTRDVSRIIPGDCACGRTFRRLARITGRSDDMLIIRGVNVYPSQIEDILLSIENVAPHYQIILDKKGSMDTVEVRVELEPGIDFDEIKTIQETSRKVRARISSALAISIDVKIVQPKSLARSQGKIQRVVDLRCGKE